MGRSRAGRERSLDLRQLRNPRATAGSGLTPLIQEAYSEGLKGLQGLLSGSLSPTPDNLAKASSPNAAGDRGVIEALRDDPRRGSAGETPGQRDGPIQRTR